MAGARRTTRGVVHLVLLVACLAAGAMCPVTAAAQDQDQELPSPDETSPDFQEGFQPKGDNQDLLDHAENDPPDSHFVGTSRSFDIAVEFAQGNAVDDDYVYQVAGAPGGVAVNATLGPRSPHRREQEVAVPGGIDPRYVSGVWTPDGRSWEYRANPRFRPSRN